MQYLKEYTKELIIAAGVVLIAAVVVIWVVAAAIRGELTYEHVIALIGAILSLMGTYLNIPTSAENAEHTTLMRLEKLKGDLEYGYFEEGEEIEGPEEDLEEGEPNE